MSFHTSKDFLINQELPDTNSSEYVAFWQEHLRRCKSGITIGGVFINPWLYWHLNFFKITRMFVDEYGNKTPSIANLALRDNEWIIAEQIDRAYKEEKPLMIFGTRRSAKSTTLASRLSYKSYCFKNGHVVLVGGSSPDINNITKYIDEFYVTRPKCFEDLRKYGTWDKTASNIQIAYNKKDVGKHKNPMTTYLFDDVDLNESKVVYSNIAVRNLEMGEKKSKSELLAGITPTEVIFDEVGKYSWKENWLALKPALFSEFGMNCLPIFVGTGGDVGASMDAEDVFLKAEDNGFLVVNLDDIGVKKKYFQFTQKSSNKVGLFMPAQLSLTAGKKIETPISEYLDRNFTEDELIQLDGLDIQVTDWENAEENINKELDAFKSKPQEYKKQQMYYPYQPEDCFMDTTKNPFPAEECRKLANDIIESGNIGEAVTLSVTDSGIIQITQSDKEPVMEFPFKGGNHDAPIMIYERPIHEDPRQIKRGCYVAGFDGYKIAKSETTDSLGSIYIFKRFVGLRGYQNQIVASYSSRPSQDLLFYRQCMLLLKLYNAECLPERDTNFYNYLRTQKSEYLLANCKNLAIGIVPNSKADTTYGLPATPQNKEHYLKVCQNYTNEQIIVDYDVDDNPISMLGCHRIPDPMLLIEFSKYGREKNFDRIAAFGHALCWHTELNSMGIVGSMDKANNDIDIDSFLKSNRTKRYNKYLHGL